MWKRYLLPLLIGLALVLALTGLRAADPYPVAALRDIAFDFYQRLKPREAPAESPVRIVDIDEASLATLGQWPWPRDRLALLVDRLGELGAAAIVFDMLFPEPDRMSPRNLAEALPGLDPATLPDTDAAFAAAIGTAPVVLGLSRLAEGPAIRLLPKSGSAVSGADPRPALPRLDAAAVPIAPLAAAASGLGVVSLETGRGGTTLRELPLVWTSGKEFFPALSVEALRLAQGTKTLVVLGETSGGGNFPAGLRVGAFDIPTTSSGSLWLYFRPPDAALYLSARDLLGVAWRRHAEAVAGRIVLIGTSASGLLDLHSTVLGDTVPGVSIHAQAIEQVVSGAYLTRADWVKGLELVGFLGLGLLTLLVTLGLGPLAGLAAGLLVIGGSAGLSWYAFAAHRLMVDPSFPLIGITLVYAAMVVVRFTIADADKRQIRRAFGFYVAPSLLTEIERNGDRLKLGGEMRTISVLFTDLRDFTPLSEALPPARLLAMLNTLFGALGARIVEQYGTIDKFVGDAIMAFWNAPVDVEDHARKACIATLGMRKTLAELNARDGFGLAAAGDGRQSLSLGMGIATGEAVVGNMGLPTRFDYSAVGDTVNIASRVEGASKSVGYDIVVVDATRAAVPDFAFLEAGSIQLRGKRRREHIHLLVGDAALAGTGAFKLLALAHADTIALLRRGADPAGGIAECRILAQQIEPGLLPFYDRLASRRGDFAPA